MHLSSDLKQRLPIATLLIALLILVISFAHHPIYHWAIVIATGLLALFAFREFLQLAARKGVHTPALILVAALLLPFCWQLDPLFVGVVWVLVALILFLYQFYLQNQPLLSIGAGVFGFGYVAVALSLIIPIVAESRALLFFLISVTKSTDIAALFIGKRWGKHSLCPAISPKKTIEGAVGGLAGAICVSLLFWITGWTPFSFWETAGLGLVIGLLAESGDLAESLLKRDAGVKDSSKTFLGLGGALDLVDSLLWTAPFFYFYLKVKG